MAASIKAGGSGYFLVNEKPYQRGAYEASFSGGTAGAETHVRIFAVDTSDGIRNILSLTEITTIESDSGTYADAAELKTALEGFFFRNIGGGGGGAVDSVNGKTGSVVLNLYDVNDVPPYPNDGDDYVLVENNGTLTWELNGGGGAVTPTNGLQDINGDVGLGGDLTQPTNVNLNNLPFVFSDFANGMTFQFSNGSLNYNSSGTTFSMGGASGIQGFTDKSIIYNSSGLPEENNLIRFSALNSGTGHTLELDAKGRTTYTNTNGEAIQYGDNYGGTNGDGYTNRDIPDWGNVKGYVDASSGGGVNSVTAGTPNVSITGTATDPVVNVAQTTAGLLTNVFFTADEVTTAEGTFYQVLINDRGTASSAIQTVDLDDNQSGAFPQDFLGNVQTEDRPILSGVYAGFPILQVNIGQSNQRFKIESYICDAEGVPLGIGDGPVGTLGVNTVLIADSGIIDLQPNNPTSVNCQGSVPNALTLGAGQRFRYVIIAEKVGTGGGVKTFSLFSGADYNSYFQIPTGGGSGPDKAQYVVSFSKAGLVANVVVLESRSSFTTPTGKYFGGNTAAFLKGIKFTCGVSQANAAGAFVVQVRYEDSGGAQQHVVGGGTLLKEQELLATAQAQGAVFNESNEVIFNAVPLVGDKVYFVDVSQMGFFQFTDLEVELLIETEVSPNSFIF